MGQRTVAARVAGTAARRAPARRSDICGALAVVRATRTCGRARTGVKETNAEETILFLCIGVGGERKGERTKVCLNLLHLEMSCEIYSTTL